MSEDPEQTQDLEITLLAQGDSPVVSGRDGADFPLPEELTSLLPRDAYVVDNVLGRGGMGTVYRGVQVRLKRPVAIKVMRRKQGQDYNFEQRFQREALAMAELNHPNIVSVIDYGEAGSEYLYIVMEFVDGADLMDVIRSGRMTQEMALILLPQICDALQFAHDHGIVHRDIKPSNIMLTRDGRVKMADFGLAKRSELENTFVTRTGVSMGTPDYAAPEQFDAGMSIDHRADIYALGVMIYQMLTGHLPRGAWRPPSQRAEVAPQWDEIVSHAIQTDPKDRYQSASDIKTDISTILPLAEKNAAAASAARPSPAKSRVLALTAVATTVLGLLGSGAFFALQKRGEPSNTALPTASEASVPGSPIAGYNVIKIGLKEEDLRNANDSQMVYDVEWQDGILVVGRKEGKGQIFDYRPYARDAILRAHVRFDPDTGSPQLCLRNQNGEQQGTFYRLWADLQDKTWKLAFVKGGKGYTLLHQWKPHQPYKASDWVLLELRAIGNKITASVGGQELGTFAHDGIPNAGGYQIFSTGRADFRDVEFIILDPPPLPADATKNSPYVNSLGMRFVPVPVTGGLTNKKRILFSIWETRERDYEAFARETRRKWSKDPVIDHQPDLPATSVNWEDAVAFSVWLTGREREMGMLKTNEAYRLPSDHEWSCAIGIGDRENPEEKPFEKRSKLKNIFPWGTSWPPPPHSGNFWSEELRPLLKAGAFPWVHSELSGYQDGYATLAPVGSFAPNVRGLYDLGGNVTEWCADWYDANQTQRGSRGSEWSFVGSPDKYNNTLLSSYRFGIRPEVRQSSNGFRLVLDLSDG